MHRLLVSKDKQLWIAPVALGILTILLRLPHLDQAPQFDELYHVLAARGWLAEGELRIAEGVYERAPLFTMLVAWCFRLFGESLEVARAPSVLAGTLLVVAVFLWTRSVAGSLAAWFTALLLALDPEAIEISQFARFYALHGLLFWLAAIATYTLVVRRPRGWSAAAMAVGALLGYGLALHLQIVTLIGLVSVSLWVALAAGVPWLRSLSTRPRVTIIGAGVILVAAVTVILIQSGIASELVEKYRSGTLWNAQHRNTFWYYHAQLILYYPTLWSLFPVAVLVGLTVRSNPVAFCSCVFAVAIVIHSFAAPKSMRYIFYAMPFLFVIWGIALAYMSRRVYETLVPILGRVLNLFKPRLLPRPLAHWSVVAAVLLFTVAANAAFVKTVVLLAGATVPPMRKPADWAGAREPLEPWLESSPIVVTTSELYALYFLGRHDILVSKSRLYEVSDVAAEFSFDPRTGRPVISTPESLNLIVDCYPQGLIVIDEFDWRNPVQLRDEVAEVVTTRTEAIELPGVREIRAYGWSRGKTSPPTTKCSALPGFSDADSTIVALDKRQSP